MCISISKAIAAGLTGLTLWLAVASSTSPALAVVIHGGGFGGGSRGGGFGGAFHPGFGSGFRQGFQPGFVGLHPGFRPGFARFHPRFVGFHRRFFHPPIFVNGVWITGWGGGYDSSCWTYGPVYDAWGNFLGQSYVNLCQ